jgi:surfeit locus 1 family protein
MPPGSAARRSPLVLGILSAIAVLVCARLGVWQLERADEKQRLHTQMAERMEAQAFELLPGFTYRDQLRFRPVVVRGRFVAGAQVLLDNRVHDGRAGAAVYAPFAVAGEPRRLLVERGWVPWSKDHARLGEAPLPEGELQLRGFLDQPPLRSAFIGEAPEAAMAGALWPYLDWQRLGAKAGPLMEGVVLREDAATDGALLRFRPALEEKRGMHLGYAVQWFSFAGIVALVALRLWWSGRRRTALMMETGTP